MKTCLLQCFSRDLPCAWAILWIFLGSSRGSVIGKLSPSSLRFTSVHASSEEFSLFSLSVVISEGLGSAVMLLRCIASSLESLLCRKSKYSSRVSYKNSHDFFKLLHTRAAKTDDIFTLTKLSITDANR